MNTTNSTTVTADKKTTRDEGESALATARRQLERAATHTDVDPSVIERLKHPTRVQRVSKASSLRAQLEHGLKEAIYNMFSWVRDQPDRNLDGLMEEIDHLFLHSEGSL